VEGVESPLPVQMCDSVFTTIQQDANANFHPNREVLVAANKVMKLKNI